MEFCGLSRVPAALVQMLIDALVLYTLTAQRTVYEVIGYRYQDVSGAFI